MPRPKGPTRPLEHGTAYGYQAHRCRCPSCRKAWAVRCAEYAGRSGLDDEGRLLVECWCQAKVLNVPARDVKAGRTASCDSPGCKSPEEDA